MIESRTKTSLSKQQIMNLTESAFGSLEGFNCRELTDGYFNTAYLVENKGRKSVLKVGPSRDLELMSYEKNIMRTEVAMMKIVQDHPEIPAPEILYSDFSRKQLPNDIYFMSFLPGTPWNKIKDSLDKEENRKLMRQLGKINNAINSISGPGFGYPGLARYFDEWFECFTYMITLVLQDALRFQIELPLDGDELLAVLSDSASLFADVDHPSLVHWDLWEGNVFIDQNGDSPEICGIIDFERAFWGDPLMEYTFRLDEEKDPFLKSYSPSVMQSEKDLKKRLFYNIYLFLIMTVEDGPRQYADKGVVHWARSELLKNWKAINRE